ncbi:MAG: FAD-dependent oxidoreductase [Phycisphaerales bacterium]|jgi:glycine/D-amino acid oxidase-like deaminating enzyme|nr:FAD-dependent oxidoreductase [Phycisphaerales bacterium]
MNSKPSIPDRVDAVIFGGGVAGLWARWRLEHAGYSTLLLEQSSLGNGQTIASQGILHRGTKYAFGKDVAQASVELQLAQEVWARALAGTDGPDLRGVAVLSPTTVMWTSESFLSRFTGAVAAGLLKSDVRRLGSEHRPAVFKAAPKAVGVWEIDEKVVDSRSLLRELSRSARGPMARLSADARPRWMKPNVLSWSDVSGQSHTTHASAAVLCAGVGNESLIASLVGDRHGSGAAAAARLVAQRRPLHMVMMRGAPCDLFGHCIRELSDKPRLTVTSARDADSFVWYLGGALAEDGVSRDGPAQVEAAKLAVRECVPWIDLSRATWATLRVDRAEGRTPSGKRPDTPIVSHIAAAGHTLAVWPTKLALAPAAAGRVFDLLETANIRPTGVFDAGESSLARALLPWNEGGVRWS